MQIQLRPLLQVLIAMFAFGMMALFTREANAPVITIATWRAIDVAILFGIAAVWQKDLRDITTTDSLKISVPYGLFLGLASSTFVGGYAFTTVANTIFLHNLAPLFTIPLAFWVFSEKAHPTVIAGALICLIGVGLISGVSLFHVSHYTNSRFLLGDFLAALSGFGYAGVLVWTKLTRRAELPVLGTLFVAWSVAALVLVVIALFAGSLSISWGSFLWVLGLALFCTNLPFYLLNLGMKHVSAGMASLLSMSEVLFATLLGVLVYQESLALIGWIGGVLVVAGVLYPFLPEREKETEPEIQTRPESWYQQRQYRALFWLVGLNIAAFFGETEGNYVVLLLSFLHLVHIGSPVLQRLVDGRRPVIQRYGIVALAFGLLYVLINNTFVVPSILFAVPILILLAGDHYFQTQEKVALQEQENASLPPEGDIRIVLGLLLLAIVSAQIDHQAHHVLFGLTLLLGGLIGLGTVLTNLRQNEDNRLLSALRMPPLRYTIVTLTGLFFVGGVHAVPVGHSALVERFGHFVAVQESGLLVRLPPPIEKVDVFDTDRIFEVDVWDTEQNLLCGDQSMITVQASLLYTIQDPKAYRYQAFAPQDLLTQQARALLVNEVRQIPHEDLLHNRGALSQAWTEALQQRSDQRALGLRIESLHFTYISVPPAVRDSFLDVLSAIEDQSTEINRAKAYASSALPKALGEAVVVHEQALSETLALQAQTDSWTKRAAALHQGSTGQQSLLLDWVTQDVYTQSPPEKPIIRGSECEIFLGSPTVPLLETAQ